MDARADGRSDDGQKVISIAHPKHSSGELETAKQNNKQTKIKQSKLNKAFKLQNSEKNRLLYAHVYHAKKGKRKAQGVPQQQTAAPPRPQV